MKILKWIGIIVGAIVLIIAASAVTLNVMASNRLNKNYETVVKAIDIPQDEVALAKGQHLVNVLCTTCHGGALEGTVFMDAGPVATVYAPNLTKGEGGVADEYTDLDWVRSIRHGIRPNKQALFIMPSHEFVNMSKEDLGAVIAYLKTVPPANKEWPQNTFRPLGKILLQLGELGDVIPAEVIDHSADYVVAPPAGPTAEYGHYVVNFSGCRTCHGADLKGIQPNEPGSPFAPDLTASGNLGKWSKEQFIETIKHRVTPDGRELTEFMPLGFSKYSEDYLTAIYAYLSTIEDVPSEK